MKLLKMIKQWRDKTKKIRVEEQAIAEEDLKLVAQVCSQLDRFKYRTLSRSQGSITLWKEDSGNIMCLTLREAKQLLIYLEFENSVVPKYQWDENNDPKVVAIQEVAKRNNYPMIDMRTSPPMISFGKDGIRINIYYSTMTVETCIKHPKKGKTQLFRKNVSLSELDKIFKNPRQHTGKGYYTN
jgi:hypothetical protein